MIRFIDLTKDYFANGPPYLPICGFVNTVTDRFIESDANQHTFHDLEDVKYIPNLHYRERCLNLVPEGFFERTYNDKQIDD